jgi:hypothetical protein
MHMQINSRRLHAIGLEIVWLRRKRLIRSNARTGLSRGAPLIGQALGLCTNYALNMACL